MDNMDYQNTSPLPWLALPVSQPPTPTNLTLPHVSSYFQSWGYKLRIYALVILTILGCTGNMLAFLVFFRSNMKKSSTGVYLISLAWFDSFCIVIELLLRSNAFAINDVICKIAFCVRTLLRLQEAFVVVAMCADRTICLRLPFKSGRCANVKTAVICVISLVFLSFFLSTYTLRIMVKYGHGCNFNYRDPYKMELEIVHFVVNTFIGEILTSLMVITMAAYIITALTSLSMRARRLSNNRAAPSVVDKEVTRMTAALALSFSLLRLPYSLVYIAFHVRHTYYEVPYRENIQQALAHTVEVFTVFSNMNYCINVLIYLLFWRAFKQKLWQILTCKPVGEAVRRRSSSRRITESTALT